MNHGVKITDRSVTFCVWGTNNSQEMSPKLIKVVPKMTTAIPTELILNTFSERLLQLRCLLRVMPISQPNQSQLLDQAHAFLQDMALDSRFSMSETDVSQRVSAIAGEIAHSGTYKHTEAELQFGVQWA